MTKQYKLIVGGKQIGTIDSRKWHGDVVECDGRKVFVFYTKGSCVYGRMEEII